MAARLMERRTYDIPGGQLSALHFGRTSNPLKLVFCHANGFNAQSYRAVLEPLGVHAVALDLRGHGRADLPTDPENLKSWQPFADDIAAFFDAHVTRPVTLAGHSYGAVSALLSLHRTRDTVHGFAGFDPVLVPGLARIGTRFAFAREYMKMRLPIARKAGERRAVFDSAQAAFDRYKGRGAFRGVPDEVLADYLEGGLDIRDDGRVRLSCDPAWEQAIFCAQSHNAFKAAPLLPDATRIVFAGGKRTITPMRLQDRIAKLQPAISVEHEADKGHLFPLSHPGFATEVLASVMQQAALTLTPRPR